ncbi:MAG: NPCBM/NEW2 domain-containing protein [Planctomycetota bacterium]
MRWSTVIALGLCWVAAAAGGQIERIDGRGSAGEVISLDDDALTVRADGAERAVPRDELVRVALSEPGDVMASHMSVLATAAGDVLRVGGLTLDEDTLAFRSELLGAVELPLGAGAVLYQPPEGMTAEAVHRKCEQMELTRGTRDVLVFARPDGNWLTVGGALRSIEAETITFHWKQKDRTFDRAKVAAVYLASTKRELPPATGTLVARDGSEIAFTGVALDAERATITSPLLGRRKIARRRVAVIRFESDRVTYLAELEPVKTTEHGVFTTFEHRLDASVGGGPLRLGGRAYQRGLGVHSFCELTWALDGRFSRFVGVVGIDDAVRPHGEAVVTFLADGEPLAEPMTVTGTDEPRTVRLDLSGARRLTLRVEMGPHDLDVGDRVDIASARLIE